MSKNGAPPPAYGFVAPPSAPPSYAQGKFIKNPNIIEIGISRVRY